MKISLQNAGKRYNREWIFRGFTGELEAGGSYALLGPNGSGKSTLLKVLSAYLRLSEGTVSYYDGEKEVDNEHIACHIGFSAPYMELIEELSVREQLFFHQRFKPFLEDLDVDSCLAYLGFERHRDKAVKSLSSGMKQRLKLMLAIGSRSRILLLDEPATNLDPEGVQWYHRLLSRYRDGRTLVIASNREDEYVMCKHYIQIEDYKVRK